MPPQNLAARAGRWSARHRRTAILGWLAFVAVAVLVGSAVGTQHIKPTDDGVGESGRASQALAGALPEHAAEQILVQSSTLTARDPAFRAAVVDVTARVSRAPYVTHVRTQAVSEDGHSALVGLDLPGSAKQESDRVGAVLAATAAAQRAHPSLRIEQFGDASSMKALDASFKRDFHQAQSLSLPLTLIILVVAFGALAAAGIPVLLALSAVGASLGLMALVSHLLAVDQAMSEVVLLVGMAVGVDYALFYLRREREERAAGRGPEAALQAAAATSGHAVLVSGCTVLVAMAGMFLTGNRTFISMAMGTMVVVAVAMLGSVTVLPALLSTLGDRVTKGRVPFLARRQAAAGGSRVWGALLDRVLRRPLVSTVLAAGVLVALAVPAFGLHTLNPGTQGLPRSLPVMKTYDRIQAAFPGGPQPAVVVVQAADVTAPPVVRAIDALRERALASGVMRAPVDVLVSANRHVAMVTVPLAGTGTDDASNRALSVLRGEIVPETVGQAATASVTGLTAGSKDFNDLMAARGPLVFAFVLTLAFVLLLVTFRSVVVPLKAIVLNLLSVGASYGVLVLVFQDGWGKHLLGFEPIGGITSWLPIFLFVILFGLSMDYHVFILSRIREAYDRGMRTEDAVSHGIRSTAGVVTSAAVVMVAVFAVFASLRALEFKQMGVGLAVAIALDATLVRGVLLPAAMKLLGDRNWYLPRALARLPRLGAAPEPEPQRA